MNKNKLSVSLALAAALLLSGCGGGAVGQADGNSAGATAHNAANRAPAVDGGANVAPATNAAEQTPVATGGGASAPNMNSRDGGRGGSNTQQANMPQPQIGSGGNDFYLFTQARGALNADADLKAANIVIEVKEGVLTLSGTVASAAQKSRAEQLARAVSGVRSVKNQLRVSAGN